MNIKEGYVVCSNEFKNKILRDAAFESTFKNYSFLTLKELEAKLFFSVPKKSILNCAINYNVNLEHAKDLTSMLTYVNKDFYNNPKLDSLVRVKKYLEDNSLLAKDPLFLKALAKKPITIINPPQNKRYLKIKAILESISSIDEICFNEAKLPKFVYSYLTVEDELNATFKKIVDLLSGGVSPKDIYLLNVTDDYYFLLDRISHNYSVSVNIPNQSSVFGLEAISYFFITANNYSDLISLMKYLADNKFSSKYTSLITNIINDYDLTNVPYLVALDVIKQELKHLKFDSVKYENAISIGKIGDSYFSDTDYVFYLGFNDATSPRVYADDDFLSDEELETLGLDTSLDKNILAPKQLLKDLGQIKNLVISFAKSSSFMEYAMSPLMSDFTEAIDEVSFGYSKTEDGLRFGKLLDLYSNYNDLAMELTKYDTSKLSYKAFNHSYKKINKDILVTKLNHPLKLSYSSVKGYFACPFSFYAAKVLALDEYESSLATRIGSYAHAILEDSYQEGFNLDESASKHMDMAIDAKDRFYFSVMQNLVKDLVDFNQAHEETSLLKDALREQKIEIEMFDSDLVFLGFIDKLKYTIINDEVYAIIIDYKTGSDIVSLDNVSDGFHLQLPLYVYMLKNSKIFGDRKVNVIGIYLQKVNIKNYKVGKKTILEQRYDSFKLQGFTSNNLYEISMIDGNYLDCSYIASLKITKDMVPDSRSKTISKMDFDRLNETCKDLIEKAYLNIQDGKFDIAPRKIEKSSACEFCKFKDLCFVSYNDFVYLEKKSFLDGGDTHALDKWTAWSY